MSFESIIYFVLIPVAVWVFARIIFTAYFKSKANYLKEFFSHGNDQQTKDQD